MHAYRMPHARRVDFDRATTIYKPRAVEYANKIKTLYPMLTPQEMALLTFTVLQDEWMAVMRGQHTRISKADEFRMEFDWFERNNHPFYASQAWGYYEMEIECPDEPDPSM